MVAELQAADLAALVESGGTGILVAMAWLAWRALGVVRSIGTDLRRWVDQQHRLGEVQAEHFKREESIFDQLFEERVTRDATVTAREDMRRELMKFSSRMDDLERKERRERAG